MGSRASAETTIARPAVPGRRFRRTDATPHSRSPGSALRVPSDPPWATRTHARSTVPTRRSNADDPVEASLAGLALCRFASVRAAARPGPRRPPRSAATSWPNPCSGSTRHAAGRRAYAGRRACVQGAGADRRSSAGHPIKGRGSDVRSIAAVGRPRASAPGSWPRGTPHDATPGRATLCRRASRRPWDRRRAAGRRFRD